MKPRTKILQPRWRCTTCKGRRVVIVDSYPVVRLRRCPSCSGTNPTAPAAIVEQRRAA